MKCENFFCVYWEAGTCWLDEIEVDELGRCFSCILVNIPPEVVEEERRKMRARYE